MSSRGVFYVSPRLLKYLVFFDSLTIILIMSKIRFNVNSVIFDMDGVITNTMPDHYHSWKTILKEEGFNVTYEDIYKREGQPGISSVRELSAEYKIDFNEKKAAQILRRKEDLFKKDRQDAIYCWCP